MTDWYYIGHYGQIGPLTPETIVDLIETGVITRETFLWRAGMPDWLPAGTVPEFSQQLTMAPLATPPPSPNSAASLAPPVTAPTAGPAYPRTYGSQLPVYGQIRSDKSRLVAGVLQFIPGIGGIGRIYLGYTAIGVLQLVSSLCGVGYIWSFVDGVLMLCGQVKYDGYGRSLPE